MKAIKIINKPLGNALTAAARLHFVMGALGACLLLLASCSTTSQLDDGEQLFVGLKKIKYSDFERNSHAYQTQEELEAALATAPNGALFGSSYYRTPFPYALWIWNATSDAKTKVADG